MQAKKNQKSKRERERERGHRRGIVKSFQSSMDSLEIDWVERCSNNLNENLILFDLRNREIGIEFKNIGSVAEFIVDPSFHVGGNRRSGHGRRKKKKKKKSKIERDFRWVRLK